MVFVLQLDKANFAEDEHVKFFGIDVSKEMTRVEGRVLEAPEIEYGREVADQNFIICTISSLVRL